MASDSFSEPIKVVFEGVPQSVTQSNLILLNNSNALRINSNILKSSSFVSSVPLVSFNLTCNLPPTALNGSITAFATVIGDLMGNVVNNLGSLIRMPYGCGEQLLYNLVRNIVVLIYLQTTNQLTTTIQTTAISYILSGYQSELSYRRTDSSFSAFGNSDAKGSTWLTSYVMKSFIWAKPFISIDQTVIDSGFSFIISKQNTNGSFREEGIVFHKDLQGGSGNGVAMTAYIVILLLENLQSYPQYTSNVNAALTYISTNLNPNDVYELTISAYALYLGVQSNLVAQATFQNVYNQLLSQRIETVDQIHWEKYVLYYPYWSVSVNIEVTAYALLLIQNFDLPMSIKIATYLESKRNSFGGYTSSQDTVVGLTALARFAALISGSSGAVRAPS